MTIDLKADIVRVLKPNGETSGTGFVVTDDGLVATCAHVVEVAGAGPGDTVRIVFHATGEEREAQVEPEWWRDPDAEDVAILRLEGPVPAGVIPLSLGSSAGVEGHTLSTFGFPDPKPVEGMVGKCEVVGRTTERGFPVLQLRSSEVTPGFSGAPVLDMVTRRVVGMVTAITVPDQYGRLPETAFITPTQTLRTVCPELQLSDLCPYQGLAAFTEDHAEFFFGREKLVADLVSHLRGNPRFLAVVGPSGSGKSSVIRAGLFPALRLGEVPGSREWHLLTFRPGADPFAALTTVGLDVPQKGNLPAAICAFLETHPQVKHLVLFADQFEELFTLCPQPIQEQFLRQLATLLEGNLSVTLVLALRADFYGHLLRHRPLVDWLKIGQVNVHPMGPKELWAAVEEPALRLGLRFEPGLVETIVEEAGEAEHPLPLLESALTQLWEKREDGTLTHAAYQAVGQVAGAIGQWAEHAYTGLAPEERPLARRVFTRLVSYGEREVADTRQQQSLSELVTRPEERETLHRLVRRLADARLLVTGGDPGAETVEIIHDALLQQWGRLKHWTAEQREFYVWRQRLGERLQEWEGKGQDEGALLRGALLVEAERWLAARPENLNPNEQDYIRESVALRERERAARERRRRQVTLAAVGAAVVFLVLALLAWGQRNIARDAQTTAVAEANIRATAQAQAEERRQDAEAAQATAVAESSIRATAQAETEEQRQTAVARQLAAQAQTVLGNTGTGLVRSLLLAVESQHRLPSLEGDQALRQGLALLPRTIAQFEHAGQVGEVAFSPDGRWLATESAYTARVWDLVTGQEVARMEHEGLVWAMALSPDGQWVVSGSGGYDSPSEVRVWEAATGREVARMEHKQRVWAVAFSPDGRWLATAGEDRTARMWDPATGQEVARMEHEGDVKTVAFSPDGRWLATGSYDNTARVWDPATGQEVARMEHEQQVMAVAFSPDGRWVVSGSWDGTARVWEATTGQMVSRMEHGHEVNAVDFSPDGRLAVSGEGNVFKSQGRVLVWEAATGQEVTRVEHEGAVNAVAFSPGGQWVASGSGDGTVRVWEAATGQEMARLEHEGGVGTITFSPDGQRVASGSSDGVVRVWEATTGQDVTRVEHGDAANAVAFSPDGQWVASGSWDGTARVWEATTGQEVARVEHNGRVRAVAFSPDGQWVASGSWDGTARVWEATTGQEIAQLEHGGEVEVVVFSPDGQQMASGDRDGIVRVWEAATGREVARMEHEDDVEAMAFSPDGRWLVTGSWDDTARVWDPTTGQEVARMEHEGVVWAMALSPDGQWLATASEDRTARVWDPATGQEVARMEHEEGVLIVAFSPNGQWVASGSGWVLSPGPGEVRVWEATTGQEVARMEHNGRMEAVAFSPDGRWLATASDDNTARVWEATTGQEVARIEHDDEALSVAFSPDGRLVASGGWDNLVRVWLWRPEDLIAEACARLHRNLTREEWQMYLPDEPYRPTCPNLPVPED